MMKELPGNPGTHLHHLFLHFMGKIKSDATTFLLPLALLVAFVAGLIVPVMEVDAAQYAAMGREMLHQENWLHLFNRGKDYLDKPPLVFWLVALSYKIFGVATWSYKLPTLLFSLIGVYSTYRLGRQMYSAQTGGIAALLLATCQAWHLMLVDPRTDMLLTTSVIFVIWQWYDYSRTLRWQSLLAGAVGAAVAMYAKGPIGLMVPVLALGIHWICTRNWRIIFHWPWLWALLVIGVLLAPMVYGLYTQFDQHPEKIHYGVKGISGVKFFFWDQSFGRLTGDSQFVNQIGHAQQANDPLFFVHTFLWSFFPWSWLFLVVVIRKAIIRLRTRQWPASAEYLTWGGIFIPWIALSFSGYKLPHYIFVFYPLAALLTARETVPLSQLRWPRIGAVISGSVIGILLILLLVYVFTPAAWWVWAGLGLLVPGLVFGPIFKDRTHFWWQFPAAMMALLFWVLNTHFYPHLLQFQVPSHTILHAGKYHVEPSEIYMWPTVSYAFELYRGQPQSTFDPDSIRNRDGLILVPQQHWGALQKETSNLYIRDTLQGIKVTKLSLPFLRPATRPNVLQHWYLAAWEHTAQ